MNSPGEEEPRAAGLCSEEARLRLARYGLNVPNSSRAGTPLFEFLAPFLSPLTLLLLGAAIVSGVAGDPTGAAILIVVVLLGAGINLFQTWHSVVTLRKLQQGVATTAAVLRDGVWGELPRAEIVPGDVIRLSAGDLVPADAVLLTARDLHLQQAALTGESLPTEKQPAPASHLDSHLPNNPAHMVFLGTSVISGMATAVVVATGAATALGEVAARVAERAPETEFDRGTRRFGYFIAQVVFFLVLFVVLLGAVQRRDALQTLLFAVALAVGLTPEFLPLITAATLARGAVRMARRKVVVKHLAAIQNLGSMDVLCSDKTGTLTLGEMTLTRTTDPFGEPSERPGHLAALNSAFETGIRSPLDAAILNGRPHDTAGYHKVDEIPFDFERRRLTAVVDGPEGRQLVTKGAPESVLTCCSDYEQAGRIATLDTEARARFLTLCREFGAQGFRLLAVAYRTCSPREAYHIDDEAGLILVGLLAFADPPRDDAAEAVRRLKHDGVRVVVLTGDNDLVAARVCDQVGITGRVVLGDELDRMTDSALGQVTEQVSIFARLNPSQKNRVIRAMKLRGHVVGYLGDGVNDAPSLHAADVGISVAGAAEVARETAEIVLLQPGLAVLHQGILEGRRAFGNVLKYLLMGTSSNFGNMLSMAAAAAFLPFLPMLPTQILLNSLLYDLAQLTIPTDRVDPGFLRRPRHWDIRLIRRFMLVLGPLSSLFDFATFWVLLSLFNASAELFHTGWFVESLATQTLVLFVIRTTGSPFWSRPAPGLTATVLAVVALGCYLPYSPLAGPLGFVPLPPEYLLFVVGGTALYLFLVERLKRLLLRRAGV